MLSSPLAHPLPSPKEMMRARHPDLYSDTHRVDEPKLSKEQFDYQLEILTTHKKEYEFEYFCRLLAEKELCPNLTVQTGPTGGGDSKVDAETYPVADEIAECWWVGRPNAGKQRWAFAFSAKKDWKAKIKKDVDSILSTDRGYNLVYFITNQYVSDRKRAKEEDALSKLKGVPIRILDRSWIIEKIFTNKRFEIAITALHLDTDISTKIIHGPRDVARLAELEELDRLIADTSRYDGARYQLVEDCLRTAILARGLERPRNEVESRFAQADFLAQKMNLRQQRLRIAYNRAWTAFWWYENYVEFNRLYDEVEMLVVGSEQSSDIDLLFNLWVLLQPTVIDGRLTDDEVKIDIRDQTLTDILEANASNTSRPNNALQARTKLELIKIYKYMSRKTFVQVEDVWRELSRIVDDSRLLGAYPIEQLGNVIREISAKFDDHEFDTLYEKIAKIIGERSSDGEAGERYAKRGQDKLVSDKPYEAIQWLGKAEALFVKEEFRRDLISALAISSCAYEQIGLLWAARAKALAALDLIFSEFEASGTMHHVALSIVNRLVWQEIKIGRITHVLDAMFLAKVIANLVKMTEEQVTKYREEREHQDIILGIHFLNFPLSTLPDVERLPDALERHGNLMSRAALLFALGHEKELHEEGYLHPFDSSEKIQSFFENYQDQPTADDISSYPLVAQGEKCSLKTIIFGVELLVEAHNTTTSLGLAESILSVLEAFLATITMKELLPYKERMRIILKENAEISSPSSVIFSKGSDSAEIIHPTELKFTTAADRQKHMDWLRDLLPSFIAKMFVSKDNAITWLEKLALDECAFSRALVFGDVLTLGRNVFGHSPKLLLADWLVDSDKRYPLLRKEVWRAFSVKTKASANQSSEPLKFEADALPAVLCKSMPRKHSDYRVISPIDSPLWNCAGWQGVLYASAQNRPPMLALVFNHEEAGKEIFRAWQERYGREDKEELLRLSIIRGISRKNPAEYAVTIGPNLLKLCNKSANLFFSSSRIHRMTPSSTTYLDVFTSAYNYFNCFYFMPAIMHKGRPSIFNDFGIMKQEIHIRQAWEITENDPDSAVFQHDDDPIIPSEAIAPPVRKVLSRLREQK